MALSKLFALVAGVSSQLTGRIAGESVALDVAVVNLPLVQAVNVQNFPAAVSTVSVSNLPAVQSVSGTFYPATQPVSGVFFQATQPVSGAVSAGITSLPSAAAATTSVTVALINILLLSTNALRKGFLLNNLGGNKVYITYGPTSSTTIYTFELAAGATYVYPFIYPYTGQLSAIRPSGSGAVIVTELA